MERSMADQEAAPDRVDLKRMKREAGVARIEFLQVNWDAFLRGVLAAAIGVVLVAVLLPEHWFKHKNVLGATAQMERMAKTLEGTKTIAPDTAKEISRLMQRPQFDCSQTDCDIALTLRNASARSRLKFLLERNLTAEATRSR
jgi:hypothetical protein